MNDTLAIERTMTMLSRYQYLILIVACAGRGRVVRSPFIPTGVYRSLVKRGFLRAIFGTGAYAIEDKGRAAVAGCAMLTTDFRTALLDHIAQPPLDGDRTACSASTPLS